ncbi:Basic helix-loop-helix DNA-binding superfamily protein, putative [Theobroma cacao]|uniref:Basic helix-loop-helix DNA-binding superfamily protein, putative n=1 Tax=Theobroma cacao TaxID=3641 RepID=A0A061FV24_THECC|nr:Basic helix-loop-helix DNA-binding superfamily protein, putative [Theobroma cacao]
MKKSGGGEASKPDRKTIERNRRIHMKALCFKLASLVPQQRFKPSKVYICIYIELLILSLPSFFLSQEYLTDFWEIVSQTDQLDLGVAYIKHLRERIEKLKVIKEQMMKSVEASSNIMNNNASGGLGLPVVEIRDLGSSIEVILISGLNKNFMLYEVIGILEQEGAEVVSASFSTVGGKIFHNLHAQVKISRVGVDTSTVFQRLQELISYY